MWLTPTGFLFATTSTPRSSGKQEGRAAKVQNIGIWRYVSFDVGGIATYLYSRFLESTSSFQVGNGNRQKYPEILLSDRCRVPVCVLLAS